jgi:DnaJ-class molecular chaperone
MRGRDIRFTLDIDFLDSINGAKRRISLAEGRTLDVAIPAGVETGQVLRLKNQGGAGVQGGPAGDALVELRVRPHTILPPRRPRCSHGLEHLADRGGGRRARPGADAGGNVTLTIPAGSNTGKVLRLKGKGVSGQGDQFVRLQVMLPETGGRGFA